MLILNNLISISWQQVLMWVIGATLIYLAIKKGMEPTPVSYTHLYMSAVAANIAASSSSVKKGETLIDTAQTIDKIGRAHV